MGGSDSHFPHILEANPHFPCIFKILTPLTFSKSSVFILTKVDTQPDFCLFRRPSNNEHFISHIPHFCSVIFAFRFKSLIFSSMILDPRIFQILDSKIFKILARNPRFPRFYP